MASGDMASCLPWTAGYAWKAGEQSCGIGADDTMYICQDIGLCGKVSPLDTTKFATLKSYS